MNTLEELRGAVARGWCADKNRTKEMDSDLADAITSEILAIWPKSCVHHTIDEVTE